MLKYDLNKGAYPKVGDSVQIAHTNSNLDGMGGIVGGMVDIEEYCAILILDVPLVGGVRAISISVPCLKQTG